jgi:glutaredoxin
MTPFRWFMVISVSLLVLRLAYPQTFGVRPVPQEAEPDEDTAASEEFEEPTPVPTYDWSRFEKVPEPAARDLATPREEPRREKEEEQISLEDIGYPDIELYTAGWCSKSTAARAFLDQNDLDYTEHDVDADPKTLRTAIDLADRDGKLHVPVVVIGETVLVGFSPESYARALDLERKKLWLEANRKRQGRD